MGVFWAALHLLANAAANATESHALPPGVTHASSSRSSAPCDGHAAPVCGHSQTSDTLLIPAFSWFEDPCIAIASLAAGKLFKAPQLIRTNEEADEHNSLGSASASGSASAAPWLSSSSSTSDTGGLSEGLSMLAAACNSE